MKHNLPDEVRVDSDGPIRIVTLNRPEERNAINTAMSNLIGSAATDLLAGQRLRLRIERSGTLAVPFFELDESDAVGAIEHNDRVRPLIGEER